MTLKVSVLGRQRPKMADYSCSSSSSSSDESSSYLYSVKYVKFGADHGGHCSGAEDDMVNLEVNEYFYLEQSFSYPLDPHDLLHLNHVDEGCSSYRNGYGSGYCRGFRQVYIAVSFERIY